MKNFRTIAFKERKKYFLDFTYADVLCFFADALVSEIIFGYIFFTVFEFCIFYLQRNLSIYGTSEKFSYYRKLRRRNVYDEHVFAHNLWEEEFSNYLFGLYIC
jgi:hypothetical protein